MDIKTIQKVINGQEDKLQELEQKANRTGQFHLDSINEKFAKLEKKINDNKDNCVSNNDYKKLWEENTKDYNVLARKRLDDYTKGIKNSEKIEALEDRVEFNINDRITTLEKKADNMLMLEQDIDRKIFARMDSIDNKIDGIYEDIGISNDEYNEGINDMSHRITKLDENIPDINQETDETRALKVYCDDLEAKYYKLRSELDSIYKVLEMDAIDIDDLYDKLENHPKKGTKYTLKCDKDNDNTYNIRDTKND